MIKAYENIDLYTVILMAYNSLDYSAKLVNDNDIDPNQDLNSGQSISYDPSLYVKDQVDIKVSKTTPSTNFTYVSREGQSWVDVLLNGYSGFDNAAKWAYNNDLVTVNAGRVDRKTFTFDYNLVANSILVTDFLSRGIEYATGFEEETIILATEDLYAITTEDGYMLLIR